MEVAIFPIEVMTMIWKNTIDYKSATFLMCTSKKMYNKLSSLKIPTTRIYSPEYLHIVNYLKSGNYYKHIKIYRTNGFTEMYHLYDIAKKCKKITFHKCSFSRKDYQQFLTTNNNIGFHYCTVTPVDKSDDSLDDDTKSYFMACQPVKQINSLVNRIHLKNIDCLDHITSFKGSGSLRYIAMCPNLRKIKWSINFEQHFLNRLSNKCQMLTHVDLTFSDSSIIDLCNLQMPNLIHLTLVCGRVIITNFSRWDMPSLKRITLPFVSEMDKLVFNFLVEKKNVCVERRTLLHMYEFRKYKKILWGKQIKRSQFSMEGNTINVF